MTTSRCWECGSPIEQHDHRTLSCRNGETRWTAEPLDSDIVDYLAEFMPETLRCVRQGIVEKRERI